MGREANMVKKHNIAEDGTWRYSGKHELYPVETHDIWKVGSHHFVCCDAENNLTNDRLLGELLNNHPPTLMYADPPWGESNAATFRTKAGVGTGLKDYEFLLQNFLFPAMKRGLVCYMENGLRWQQRAIDVIKGLGGTVSGSWDITYYGKKPCILLAADFRDNPINDHPNFTGLDDEDTPNLALKSQPIGTVYDPCSGRGLTARTAEKRKWASINRELSPYRIAEAMHSVSILNGCVPEKIET